MDSLNETGFVCELHREGGHVVVAFRGELDMAGSPELDECLQQLRASRVVQVTVDLAGLEFCDSSGLAIFPRFHREAERAGSTLVLRSPQPNVRRMFELTGTEALLAEAQPASAGSGTTTRA